jgi:hypothetical protein
LPKEQPIKEQLRKYQNFTIQDDSRAIIEDEELKEEDNDEEMH